MVDSILFGVVFILSLYFVLRIRFICKKRVELFIKGYESKYFDRYDAIPSFFNMVFVNFWVWDFDKLKVSK